MPEQEVGKALLTAALAARENAYAPYSGFKVGAAVLDEHGRIHAGANVENAAYPVGQCAEASAIGALVSCGGTKIKAVAVVAGGPELCTPCGACRQRIREFGDENTPVFVASLDGVPHRFSLAELLPSSFGPRNLT